MAPFSLRSFAVCMPTAPNPWIATLAFLLASLSTGERVQLRTSKGEVLALRVAEVRISDNNH